MSCSSAADTPARWFSLPAHSQARGSSNVEIAEEIFIGAATVKSHVSSILTKLGLRDRAQAVVFAYESGLIEAGDHDIGH